MGTIYHSYITPSLVDLKKIWSVAYLETIVYTVLEPKYRQLRSPRHRSSHHSIVSRVEAVESHRIPFPPNTRENYPR